MPSARFQLGMPSMMRKTTRDWTRSQQLPRCLWRQRQKRHLRQQRRLRRLPAVVGYMRARVRRHLACRLHRLLLLRARVRRHLACRLHRLLLLGARVRRHLARHCLLRETHHNRLLLRFYWMPTNLSQVLVVLLRLPLWLYSCAYQTLGRKMHHQGAPQFACTQVKGPEGCILFGGRPSCHQEPGHLRAHTPGRLASCKASLGRGPR